MRCQIEFHLLADRASLRNNTPVLNMQTEVLNILRSVLNAQTMHNWFPRIMEIIQDCRTVGESTRQRLGSYIQSHVSPIKFPNSLLRYIRAAPESV